MSTTPKITFVHNNDWCLLVKYHKNKLETFQLDTKYTFLYCSYFSSVYSLHLINYKNLYQQATVRSQNRDVLDLKKNKILT